MSMKCLYGIIFFLFGNSLFAKCFNVANDTKSILNPGDEVVYSTLQSRGGFPSTFTRAGTIISQLSQEEITQFHNVDEENNGFLFYQVKELNYAPAGVVVWRFNSGLGELERSDGLWRVSDRFGIYKRTKCVIIQGNIYSEGSQVKLRIGRGRSVHHLKALKLYEDGSALVGKNLDGDIFDLYLKRGDAIFEEDVISLYIKHL